MAGPGFWTVLNRSETISACQQACMRRKCVIGVTRYGARQLHTYACARGRGGAAVACISTGVRSVCWAAAVRFQSDMWGLKPEAAGARLCRNTRMGGVCCNVQGSRGGARRRDWLRAGVGGGGRRTAHTLARAWAGGKW
jgi:hypothetical protein